MNERSFILNDKRYSYDARVCACAMLFAGITSEGIADVLGQSRLRIMHHLKRLTDAGCLSRGMSEGQNWEYVYHVTKKGRQLVDAEGGRVRAEAWAVLSRAKARKWVRLELVDALEEQMKAGLRKDSV